MTIKSRVYTNVIWPVYGVSQKWSDSNERQAEIGLGIVPSDALDALSKIATM